MSDAAKGKAMGWIQQNRLSFYCLYPFIIFLRYQGRRIIPIYSFKSTMWCLNISNVNQNLSKILFFLNGFSSVIFPWLFLNKHRIGKNEMKWNGKPQQKYEWEYNQYKKQSENLVILISSLDNCWTSISCRQR